MPINCSVSVRSISQDEFSLLDYQVMRHAFDSQNALGRLCDETIYQNDVAARLESAGCLVRAKPRVTVTDRDFVKNYSPDLIVADAAIYELKTNASLVVEHDAQLLNYLFLHGAQHGKLINFRPAQVESRFVNTTLTPQARREFAVDTKRWQENDDPSRLLRSCLIDLMEDWGGFLELSLYLEAVTHFLGGEEKVVHMVPLVRDNIRLGCQRIRLLTPDTGLHFTALSEGLDRFEPHLRSLIAYSPLRAVQWVNFGRHLLQFITVPKRKIAE